MENLGAINIFAAANFQTVAQSPPPPSCDRLGRFELASSPCWTGLVHSRPSVYCPGLLRIPILPTKPTERRPYIETHRTGPPMPTDRPWQATARICRA